MSKEIRCSGGAAIQSLSRHFNVNANYISQLFKKEVGTTFTDQLPVITLKNAKRN